ncbi:hypothetical protein MOQ_006163, partial [Trypanosoma cruzi marinkellei]
MGVQFCFRSRKSVLTIYSWMCTQNRSFSLSLSLSLSNYIY